VLLTHPLTTRPGYYWPLVVAAALTQMTVHELAHAVVCQALGAPIREAGIKLWSVFFPVPYVDRTDSYRVRRRAGRVAIALAGPLVDVTCLGIGAVLFAVFGGRVLGSLVAWQLVLVVTNLNPVLATDGHQAIEAAVGEVNLRHRAYAYLTHIVLRVPLSGALRAAPARRRVAYVGYGVFSVLYLVGLITLFLGTIAAMIGRYA